ncbi:MAG: C_GCAxxG_C_C family protein [Oscillospiraceae bacterium]|nr:C_GCAxxG_C_C family protein [Oscillospiraceae bacterium]
MDIKELTWTPFPPDEDENTPHVNCFQRTMKHFAGHLGLTEEEYMGIGKYFGGGMRCGWTCGPVNAGLLILGRLFGNDPEQCWLGREFLEAFYAENGSWLCSEIKDEEKLHCDHAIEWTIRFIEDCIEKAKKA